MPCQELQLTWHLHPYGLWQFFFPISWQNAQKTQIFVHWIIQSTNKIRRPERDVSRMFCCTKSLQLIRTPQRGESSRGLGRKVLQAPEDNSDWGRCFLGLTYSHHPKCCLSRNKHGASTRPLEHPSTTPQCGRQQGFHKDYVEGIGAYHHFYRPSGIFSFCWIYLPAGICSLVFYPLAAYFWTAWHLFSQVLQHISRSS